MDEKPDRQTDPQGFIVWLISKHAWQINAMNREMNEVEQTLGRALHYPRFCDDQKNFPGTTDADGVVTGDHSPVTLAREVAARIKYLEGESDD